MVELADYPFKTDPADVDQGLRNLPDRLTEIFLNVKDFGATGDGETDDTQAFNDAIDYAWRLFILAHATVAGATIYIPAGTYYIGTPPLRLDGARNPAVETHNGVCNFVGAGRSATILKGDYFTGEQFESHDCSFLVLCGERGIKGVGEIRNLTIWNESVGIASGALMIANSGNEVSVDNCHFKGFIGLVHSIQTFGTSTTNCLFTCTKPISTASDATLSPLWDIDNFGLPDVFVPGVGPGTGYLPPGKLYASIGAAMAQVFAANNTAVGFDLGFMFNEIGIEAIGNRAVQCGVGFQFGYVVGTPGEGEFGEDGFASFSHGGPFATGRFISNRAERCTQGLYGGMSVTASTSISGADGPYVPATISGMSWNVGTHVVTVTTVDAHNLTSGLKVCIDPASWTPDEDYPIVTITEGANGSQFTYPGPASAPPSFSTGAWNYPREYGHNVGGGPGNAMYCSNVSQIPVATADFAIPSNTADRNHVMCMRAPKGWSLPSVFNNAAPGWQFLQCDTDFIQTYSGIVDQYTAVYHTLGFQTAMEFGISDGTAGAAFGDTVTGGGSTHYKIRWNGSNWKRVG